MLNHSPTSSAPTLSQRVCFKFAALRAGQPLELAAIRTARPAGTVPISHRCTVIHRGRAARNDATRRLGADAAGEIYRHEITVKPRPQLPVQRVDACSPYRDADLAGVGMRLIDVDDLQHVGFALTIERLSWIFPLQFL
ncbi:hypothetical protein A6R70_21475 [Agrobacterium rubi]|nr:hypothetical protein [Agrobacterium rubi]